MITNEKYTARSARPELPADRIGRAPSLAHTIPCPKLCPVLLAPKQRATNA